MNRRPWDYDVLVGFWLGPRVRGSSRDVSKVGSQLFTTEGPRRCSTASRGLGFDIFLDMKFPRTFKNNVGGAVAAAGPYLDEGSGPGSNVPCFRLGVELMRAARGRAVGATEKIPVRLLMAVTI